MAKRDMAYRGEPGAAEAAAKRRVKDAAERALAEAEERRRASQPGEPPREIDGREGPEPVRFGDWENKGRATDF